MLTHNPQNNRSMLYLHLHPHSTATTSTTPFLSIQEKYTKKHIPLPQNGEISTTEVALLTFLDSFHSEKPEIKNKRR